MWQMFTEIQGQLSSGSEQCTSSTIRHTAIEFYLQLVNMKVIEGHKLTKNHLENICNPG
jgi:hypothetical protein